MRERTVDTAQDDEGRRVGAAELHCAGISSIHAHGNGLKPMLTGTADVSTLRMGEDAQRQRRKLAMPCEGQLFVAA